MDPRAVARVVERISNPPQVNPELKALSPQEARILDLIAEGQTNRQIADSMYLSEKTVKNYVTGLLAKLRMNSRTEAAIYATKLRTARVTADSGLRVSSPADQGGQIDAAASELAFEARSFRLRVGKVGDIDRDVVFGAQADERPVICDLGGQRLVDRGAPVVTVVEHLDPKDERIVDQRAPGSFVHPPLEGRRQDVDVHAHAFHCGRIESAVGRDFVPMLDRSVDSGHSSCRSGNASIEAVDERFCRTRRGQRQRDQGPSRRDLCFHSFEPLHLDNAEHRSPHGEGSM